jgi:hypothetical protein
MQQGSRLSRRELGAAGAAVAAATIIPRHVLGGAKFVPPSEKISIAYIGCGTQGLRQLMPALEHPELNVVAVCDPNRRSDDYPEWGRDELNGKVRRFLGDPEWARGARGGVCGREVGLAVVNHHYAKQKRSGEHGDCRGYADVRQLLEKEKGIDGVYIMTPDHLHGAIAIRAMRLGRHVIVHKPLANVLNETGLARDVARETGVATHMFCAADRPTTPLIREWLNAGAIGTVREVHNWSSRPFWPQGMTQYPAERPPVPEGLEWDLWLGPAAQRPYHPAYTHAAFRGWYDFGAGALGDMGHYSFFQIFRILGLGRALSVEASRSHYWSITGYQWRKEANHVAFPQSSVIRWEFAGPGGEVPVMLHWYDGGMRPPVPEELKAQGAQLPAEGMLFVGQQGRILAGFTGDSPRLLPPARMKEFEAPTQSLPRPARELDQWIRACKGGPASDASFENVYPFAEAIQLGNAALRIEKRLLWDADKMAFSNAPEAQGLLSRRNRGGWEV